jgi:inner membrane protein
MDSITQAALGASVGELLLGRKVGNKAPIWGAIAGTIPDLDMIPCKLMGPIFEIAHHRGLTHSLLFAFLASPVFGWAVSRFHRRAEVGVWPWTQLFFWTFLTHALLDCFTTWGTQLFWPFTQDAIAWKSIFVIDPLYTAPLLLGVILAMRQDRDSPRRRRLNQLGLLISSAYLALTVGNKLYVESVFEKALAAQSIHAERISTRPTLFNNLLWAVTAETENAYHVGYYSLLDSHQDISFYRVDKAHHLLGPIRDHPDIQTLLWVTDGYYTVESIENGLRLNDLRFGQGPGWEHGTGQFIFAYEITPLNSDGSHALDIVRVQPSFKRGPELLRTYWERMKGI